MEIVDVWAQNTDVFAYCVGSTIDASFSCKEISVNGKAYKVDAFDVLTSLSGAVAAVLKINGEIGKDLKQGNFKIIS